MECMNRMGPDEAEHLEERYRRAAARIEEATDRHDRRRAVGRLYEMSWKNPYAAYRAGEVSEFGLYGRTPDHIEAANMYLRAHRLGDTRATWKLIERNPCSVPPEEAEAGRRRLFMDAALPVRTRLADGTWDCEAADGFIEEAEARAERSSALRELLTEALFRAGDGRCRVWAERSAADGCERSRLVLALCLLEDADSAEDPEDGARSFAEAVGILEGTDDWMAHLALADILFSSRFTESDDATALDHLLKAVSSGGDPDGMRAAALPYLEYYAASLEGMEPETRFLSRSGEASFPGRSVRTEYPPLSWSAVPEWTLLMRVTRTGEDGVTDYRELRNDGGGFEDDVFAVIPMSSGHDMPDAPASFVFKPTGLEMELGDDCRVVRAVYEDLDEEQLRTVFLICVDSARRSVGRLRA